jgi:tRNA A-37 threonylcarbamoyl transferase component Bud32
VQCLFAKTEMTYLVDSLIYTTFVLMLYVVVRDFQESMDPASQGGVQQDMQGPNSYLVLSQTAAERISHLKSGWDGHQSSGTNVSLLLETPHLNKMQCNLLVECLLSSMDKVNEQMRSNPESVCAMTLTEFYQIVIGCEKLILQCCDPNWQTAAIWVMDCKSTFLLWISKLLWCSAIIENATWQDAAFTERIDKISRKLSDYAEMDRNQLKNMLLEVSTVFFSRYVNGDLVTYLSQRVDARGGEVVECAPNPLLMDTIGEGFSAMVYKAIMFNESVAIKVLDMHSRGTGDNLEASIMAKLNHPGIVPMVGVTSHPDDGRPCLIMELMSGDLDHLIVSRPRFSLHVSVDIMLQIAEAMQHIHNAGLVHRDLKPNNILFKVVEDEQLSSAGFLVVKVADFGTATQSKEGELSKNLEYVGTTLYMAPEVLMAREKIESVRMRNSNVVDVYSFGIVCYQILFGKLPFENRAPIEIHRRVRAGERPRLPDDCPPILASLIKRCWASEPNSRPDFERIWLELRDIKTKVITDYLL